MQPTFKIILLLKELFDKLVFATDFVFEDINNIVFGSKHVLEVACQGVETVVRISHSFFFNNGHAALATGVCASAVVLLVVHYVHSLHFCSTVNAWDQYIRTCCLMLVNLASNALGLAFGIRFALHRLEMAKLIVILNFRV